MTTHACVSAQIRSMIETWEWTSSDKILHVLPLHHVHGVINVLGCALWSGAECEMMGKFEAGMVWRKFAENLSSSHQKKISLFMAVPTIYCKKINKNIASLFLNLSSKIDIRMGKINPRR